jgi:hypothetical protein
VPRPLERGEAKDGFLGCRDPSQCSYHYSGMQRLFSTFPSGWPGFGLLLLRLGVGIALISFGISGFFAATGEPGAIARVSVEAAGAILLILGLWTPVAGASIALDELWIALSLYSSPSRGHWNLVFLAGSSSIWRTALGVGRTPTKEGPLRQPSRGLIPVRSRGDTQAGYLHNRKRKKAVR